MLPRWANQTITVTRASLVTASKRVERDWANAQTHTIDGCLVNSTSTSRDFGDRSAVVSVDNLLLAPIDADVEDGDRIDWGGRTYVIDGVPYPCVSPTGRVSHVEAPLRAWR